MSMREITELRKSALTGVALGNDDLAHISNKVGLANYVRIADEIKKILPSGKILDWGCGYGHLTYLMRNRGLDVTAYEVKKRKNIEKFPIFSEIDIIYGSENSPLPFSAEAFDAVLSCGTLEHVSDMKASAVDVKKVLKKNGIFFIYMLPGKFSYTEWLAEKRGISVHPVKFTGKDISVLLNNSGFEIIKIKRNNVLPKSMIGFPQFVKNIYGSMNFIINPLDGLLSKIPLINLLSGVFEVVAIKK